MQGDEDKSRSNNIFTATAFPSHKKDEFFHNAIQRACDQVKKELYYRIAVGFFACAFILAIVWRGADAAAEVLNQLSLASSITSIFLAFVAIIYAFYQSKITSEQSGQMQTYLKEIGEQVSALSNISTEIEQFRTKFDDRMQAVSEIRNGISQFSDKIEEFVSTVTRVAEKLKETGNTELANTLHEEIERLKNFNSQQSTKVSENLTQIESDLPSNLFVGIPRFVLDIEPKDGVSYIDVIKELGGFFPSHTVFSKLAEGDKGISIGIRPHGYVDLTQVVNDIKRKVKTFSLINLQ